MSDKKETKDQPKEVDYLSMSDEEILNMPMPEVVIPSESDEAPDEDDDDDKDESNEKGEENVQEGQEEEVKDKDDDEDEDEVSESSAEDDEATESSKESKKPEKPKKELKEEKDPEKVEADQVKSETNELDYKKEYARLLTPFKANGRDIKVDSVDEAITLMQMGANYNKKMAALKPNLKLLKMLEQNNLLTEEKIGFLIDLTKKDSGAINKLVKDTGIDPMDLDAEKASAYKQTSYTVDDREIELDTVLDELQGSEAYTRTLDIVGNKWDAASKQVIANSPQLIRVIHDHVSSGIYDLISKEMDRERMLGRLTGLSDIESYRQIGDQLHAKGAFNRIAQGSSQDDQQPAPAGSVVKPKPKVVEQDDKRKDKRRAASPSKPAAPSSTPADFNPLALSDEEFSKLVNNQFL